MSSLARSKQNGATLIEVLVAVLVLSVGVLGLTGLQMTSIQANKSAYYRSQATLLASDMADRMRANRTLALGNAYTGVDFPTSASNNAETGNAAQIDIAQWLNQLNRALPDGTGKIERNGTIVTIQVRWNDTRGEIKSGSSDTTAHTATFVYRTEI